MLHKAGKRAGWLNGRPGREDLTKLPETEPSRHVGDFVKSLKRRCDGAEPEQKKTKDTAAVSAQSSSCCGSVALGDFVYQGDGVFTLMEKHEGRSLMCWNLDAVEEYDHQLAVGPAGWKPIVDEIKDALSARQRIIIRQTLLGPSGEGQGLTNAQKQLAKKL